MKRKRLEPPKTIGQHQYAILSKSNDKINPIELQRDIHKGTNSERSFEEEVYDACERGINDPKIEGDFYIVVLFKKERHLKTTVRQYFFYRQSCPTPQYDQTVYRYIRKSDEIRYLWTVPDKSTCETLPFDKHLIPEDHQLLVVMTENFNNGELDRYAMRLNGEI
jgi:hypothetical protein